MELYSEEFYDPKNTHYVFSMTLILALAVPAYAKDDSKALISFFEEHQQDWYFYGPEDAAQGQLPVEGINLEKALGDPKLDLASAIQAIKDNGTMFYFAVLDSSFAPTLFSPGVSSYLIPNPYEYNFPAQQDEDDGDSDTGIGFNGVKDDLFYSYDPVGHDIQNGVGSELARAYQQCQRGLDIVIYPEQWNCEQIEQIFLWRWGNETKNKAPYLIKEEFGIYKENYKKYRERYDNELKTSKRYRDALQTYAKSSQDLSFSNFLKQALSENEEGLTKNIAEKLLVYLPIAPEFESSELIEARTALEEIIKNNYSEYYYIEWEKLRMNRYNASMPLTRDRAQDLRDANTRGRELNLNFPIGQGYPDATSNYLSFQRFAGLVGHHGTSTSDMILRFYDRLGLRDHVKFIIVRVLPGSVYYEDTTNHVAPGIYYAGKAIEALQANDPEGKHQYVVSISISKEQETNLGKAAITKALEEFDRITHHVPIIKSGGNDGTPNDIDNNFPSPFPSFDPNADHYPNWLVVGYLHSDSDLIVSPSSNHFVDIFAPGTNMFLRSESVGSEKLRNGSSYAAPLTAAFVGLGQSQYEGEKDPEGMWRSEVLKEIIKSSRSPISRNSVKGYKRIVSFNADQSMEFGKSLSPYYQSIRGSEQGGILDAYETLWSLKNKHRCRLLRCFRK